MERIRKQATKPKIYMEKGLWVCEFDHCIARAYTMRESYLKFLKGFGNMLKIVNIEGWGI